MVANNIALTKAAIIPSILSSAEKGEVRKVFVKNIAEDIPDSLIESLLRVGFLPPFHLVLSAETNIGLWTCSLLEED